MLHRVNSGALVGPAIFLTSIRAASSDFEARRLVAQSARHRRQRAPGTGPMLVPSLQRYQAYPVSMPKIGITADTAAAMGPNGLAPTPRHIEAA